MSYGDLVTDGKWKGYTAGQGTGEQCKVCGEETTVMSKVQGYGYSQCQPCRKRKDTLNQTLRKAKRRSKKKNVPCDLTLKDIKELQVAYCPYLGVRLTYGAGERTDNTASLDRIVPELGYVRGNVQFVSFLANKMKQNADFNQLLTFAANVQRLHGGQR